LILNADSRYNKSTGISPHFYMDRNLGLWYIYSAALAEDFGEKSLKGAEEKKCITS
jgi:hypothetical protein